MQQKDSAQSDWCINGSKINVWVDASFVVKGVVLENNGTMLEDACWPWPTNDAQCINLSEMDAAIKGINLALQW